MHALRRSAIAVPLLLVGLVLVQLPAEARSKRVVIDSEQLVAESLPLLLGQALQSDRAWEDLVWLCDRIGHRLAGSEALDRAIAWATSRMEEGGLDAVRNEPVMVPVWRRGAERLSMVAPLERELLMLGLGGSVGTGGEPIEADVVVAHSFEELRAMPDEAIAGRIVLWDVPFVGYGETVQYRSRGAMEAASRGAVASLVRSVTPVSLGTPHTGGQRLQDPATAIPGAAITVEDSATIARLAARGVAVRLRLSMEASTAEDVPSANVVGDVLGRERPDEVVVLGCHLDSWDVGQGAQDDGAGCVIVLEAARLIAALPIRPRRTVRVVLYTNEENGGRGGKGYAEQHADELDLHFAALESDIGAGEPLGWRLDVRTGADTAAVDANRAALELRLAPLAEALATLGAGGLREGWGGADIGPIVRKGVPGLGLDNDTTGYWPVHHTVADTIDKIDPHVLSRNVAVMAMTAFWLAEQDEPLVDRSQPVYEPR
jgi:carboxypeptidase Q